MWLLRVVLIVFSILVAAGGLFIAYPRLWESQSMLDRLRAAAGRDRENPDAWDALGRQYAKGGRFEDAFRAFIAALEADPGMEEVRSALDGLPLPVAVVAAAEARVFVRTGRYRDALAVLDRAAAQGEAESISALKGYLMAVPGPPSSPNQFFQPDEARKIAQSLGPETRSTLSGCLLRLQIMRLEGNEAAMRELLSGIPAELESEPEIRGYMELVDGN